MLARRNAMSSPVCSSSAVQYDLTARSCDHSFEQVLTEFNFGREQSGKVFSGIGGENRVFDLNPDAGFDYKHELQAFLDRRAANKRQRGVCCIT